MKTKLLNIFRLRATLLIVLMCAAFTGAWADDYELYSGDLTEGDYIIYYNGKAMNTTVTSGRLQYEEVTPANDVITTTDATIVWHIAQSGDYWTIYNADAKAYAAGTEVKNKAQMINVGTDDKALWTVSGTETYEFVNKANVAAVVNSNLRNNGTYGFACYATGTGGALSLYKKKAADPTMTDVTLSFPQSGYSVNLGESFTAPTLNKSADVPVSYSSSKESVATVNTTTGAITIVGAGVTTITASFDGDNIYNSASAHYSLTVVNPNANDGSKEHPYTVAEARAAIDAGSGITNVYVTGIVSKIVTAYDSQYGNISYNISADGTTTSDQLQAYRGFSYNGDWFTSADDLQVGATVVIYGNLTKYNNIYEFAADNYLISYQAPTGDEDPFVDDDPNAEVGDVALNVPIVNGVRQEPSIETSGFVLNTVGYLYNVGTGKFFTESSTGTQASIGENGILVKFTESSSAYLLNSYSLNSALGAGWYHTYFAGEESLAVDGRNHANRRFSIVDNNGTFRLTSWENDSEWGVYSGSLFVGLKKSNSSNTTLSPFLLPTEGDVDWALVTRAQYKSYTLSIQLYNKAQVLKGLIDQIEELNSDASSVKSVYLNADATEEEIEEATTIAQALYQQAVINKPEYVQPLLEEAMTEMQGYTTSLMGKTEFAALTQALADAQTAIDSQSGMSDALNNLNSIKESVIASVNQFTTEGVEVSLTNLKDLINTAPIYQLEVAPTDVTGTYNFISYAAEKGDASNEPVFREEGEMRVYARGIFTIVSGGDNMTSIVFNLSSQGKQRLAAITASTGSITQQAEGDQTVTWTGNASTVTFTVGDRADFGTSGNTAAGQFDFTDFTINLLADGETKYNATTKASINALIESIEGNTGYETSEISQLKTDISAAANSYNTSVAAYQNLKLAIGSLQSLVNKKASLATLNASQTLLNQATTGYNACTLTDQEANDLATTLSSQKSTLQNSITKYTNWAEALENLKTELDKNQKVSAAVHNEAQSMYDTDYNAYQEGSVADDQVQGKINQLNSACNNLVNSATYYAGVANALSELETVVTQKAMKSLIDEATTLLNEKNAEYEQGTLVYDASLIGNIQTLKENIDASATEYAQLAIAIAKLAAAIEEVSGETAHVSNTTRTKANLRLTQTQNQYEQGTITDEQIPTRITTIDDLCEELTHSVHLYNLFNESLAALKTELDKNSKVDATVRSAAQTLYDDDSTAYEEGSIDDDNIEEEVGKLQTAITNLQNSAILYEQLAEAIPALQTAAAKKAMQNLIDEAENLLNTTLGDYEVGTINDEDIEERISNMIDIETRIDESAELYALLVPAIAKLAAAIEEVSGETAHVSNTTRTKANLRLTQTQSQYEQGTITNEQIPTRITTIDDLCEELTHSVHLYNQFNESLAALKTELDKNSKVDATVRSAAQTLYDDDSTAYEEGSIDDDNIEEEVGKLQTAITNLQNSAILYEQLAEAIPALQTAAAKKAMQSLIDEAENLLNTTLGDYEVGTINDEDIEERISNMIDIETRIDESAELYALLVPAIAKLAAAIEEVSGETAHVSNTTRTKANLRLTQTQNQYEQGTITDEQIPTRITTIDDLCEELTHSVHLYNLFNENIAALKAELEKNEKVYVDVRTAAETAYDTALNAYNEASIDDANIPAEISKLNAEVTKLQNSAAAYEGLNEAIASLETATENALGKVAEGLLTNGSTLLSTAQTAYEQGTIDDADIEAKKAELFNAAANLNAAEGLDAKAQARTTELAELSSALTEAESLLAQAKTDVATCYIESEKKSAIEAKLDEYTNSLNQFNSDYEGMNDRLSADLQTQSNAINSISTAYAPALGAAVTDLTNMEQEIADALAEVNGMADYLNEEPVASIVASSNIVELTAEYGTFCSGLDLDFTDVEGLKAYIVAAYIPADGKVILTRVYNVPAGTGLVVRGTPDGRYEIPAGDGTTVLSNLLVGTTRSKDLPVEENGKTNCILADGSFGLGFYPTFGGILPAGKAYLPLPSSALNTTNGVKGFTLVFDDATGIDGVKAAGQEDIWYTVGGQMLQQKPSIPGIYVRNGKKVLVK